MMQLKLCPPGKFLKLTLLGMLSSDLTDTFSFVALHAALFEWLFYEFSYTKSSQDDNRVFCYENSM